MWCGVLCAVTVLTTALPALPMISYGFLSYPVVFYSLYLHPQQTMYREIEGCDVNVSKSKYHMPASQEIKNIARKTGPVQRICADKFVKQCKAINTSNRAKSYSEENIFGQPASAPWVRGPPCMVGSAGAVVTPLLVSDVRSRYTITVPTC